MPNKMKTGYVYPKGITNLFKQRGFDITYCRGTINTLKQEVSKGSPVIVLIRYNTEKNCLHYVPVVGFDEENIYIAESLSELVNSNHKAYNRVIGIPEFKKLWNTRMLKMPFYKNTYFRITKKEN